MGRRDLLRGLRPMIFLAVQASGFFSEPSFQREIVPLERRVW